MCETGILHEWVVAQKWQQSCGTLLPGKVQTKGGEPTPVCENLELCNKLLKLGVSKLERKKNRQNNVH